MKVSKILVFRVSLFFKGKYNRSIYSDIYFVGMF